MERTFAAWGLDEPGWTATQLISELATNCVIHARTEFVVEITREGDRVRVRVRDSSPAVPAARRYGQESTTGRGLRMVESMSLQWGVELHSTGGGKSVWYELDTSGRNTALTWDDGEEVDLDALLDQVGDDDLGPVDHGAPERPAGGQRTGARLAA